MKHHHKLISILKTQEDTKKLEVAIKAKNIENAFNLLAIELGNPVALVNATETALDITYKLPITKERFSLLHLLHCFGLDPKKNRPEIRDPNTRRIQTEFLPGIQRGIDNLVNSLLNNAEGAASNTIYQYSGLNFENRDTYYFWFLAYTVLEKDPRLNMTQQESLRKSNQVMGILKCALPEETKTRAILHHLETLNKNESLLISNFGVKTHAISVVIKKTDEEKFKITICNRGKIDPKEVQQEYLFETKEAVELWLRKMKEFRNSLEDTSKIHQIYDHTESVSTKITESPLELISGQKSTRVCGWSQYSGGLRVVLGKTAPYRDLKENLLTVLTPQVGPELQEKIARFKEERIQRKEFLQKEKEILESETPDLNKAQMLINNFKEWLSTKPSRENADKQARRLIITIQNTLKITNCAVALRQINKLTIATKETYEAIQEEVLQNLERL